MVDKVLGSKNSAPYLFMAGLRHGVTRGMLNHSARHTSKSSSIALIGMTCLLGLFVFKG